MSEFQWQGGKKAGIFSIKLLLAISTLMTSSKPVPSQRPHLQVVTLGVRASTCDFRGDTVRSIA